MTDLDEVPEGTEAGSCIDCKAWTAKGRIVRLIHSNSGPGSVLVRCAGCCARPYRRRPDPTAPRTYSL